jgi:hypothetical protein
MILSAENIDYILEKSIERILNKNKEFHTEKKKRLASKNSDINSDHQIIEIYATGCDACCRGYATQCGNGQCICIDAGATAPQDVMGGQNACGVLSGDFFLHKLLYCLAVFMISIATCVLIYMIQ